MEAQWRPNRKPKSCLVEAKKEALLKADTASYGNLIEVPYRVQ